MEIERTSLSDVLLFTPKRHGDPRGYFCEVFRDDVFARNAGPVSFVQDNHSRSARKGTLRGLHYQKKPFAQGKLCLLYTSPSPRDKRQSRMPSSA